MYDSIPIAPKPPSTKPLLVLLLNILLSFYHNSAHSLLYLPAPLCLLLTPILLILLFGFHSFNNFFKKIAELYFYLVFLLIFPSPFLVHY